MLAEQLECFELVRHTDLALDAHPGIGRDLLDLDRCNGGGIVRAGVRQQLSVLKIHHICSVDERHLCQLTHNALLIDPRPAGQLRHGGINARTDFRFVQVFRADRPGGFRAVSCTDGRLRGTQVDEVFLDEPFLFACHGFTSFRARKSTLVSKSAFPEVFPML